MHSILYKEKTPEITAALQAIKQILFSDELRTGLVPAKCPQHSKMLSLNNLERQADQISFIPFPTPFSYEVLDQVASKEAYSFTDGFSGYHQVWITEEDKKQTIFTTEWGSFAYNVMPFGLKNAPAVLSRIVIAAFRDYIQKILEVWYGKSPKQLTRAADIRELF